MPSVISRIQDIMATEGAGPRQIDLSGVFEGAGLTYAVENSDGTVVSGATVDPAGVLTLETGALGHSDLRVTATDAQGQAVQDVFRVRVAGPNAYTIAVLPDTQNYTSGSGDAEAETFYRMTQWLVDNKDAHRLQFVTHVGDITDDNLASQWVVAERAMRILDGQIPYSLLPGNHDQALGGTAADHSTEFLDTLFSPAKQSAVNAGNFGGVYDREPGRSANTYSTFTAPDGTKWLVLSLEFGPRDDVLRWAGDVIGEHLDHRVFLLSHALTNWASRHDSTGSSLYDEGTGANYGMRNDPQGANDGEAVYRQLLSRFPNVTFTFSGHIFGDGAETIVSYSQHGNPVFEMLNNYQNGVAREITGNGDEALGTRGGNGAIRLVVIDPDNGRVSTETYFTDLDDYLDGFRGQPELDRDGLTGPYRGHQETFTGLDLGPPALRAVADAGDDRIVSAQGDAAAASVQLDASATLDPAGDAALFAWRDASGELVATGRTATVDLGIGRHFLTLSVTDTAGRVTTDQARVIVQGAGTLLVETFDDGDAEGWALPASDPLAIGTPASFGLPELPGGTESVARIPPLGQPATLLLQPNLGAPAGTLIGSFSLVLDILVPAGQGTWTALLQTNTANTDDGELFIRNNGDGTGGIGIGGDYTGAFQYGAWQRVGFTFQEGAGGSVTLNKYIDGTNVGTQTLSGDRFRLDAGRGALLFTDNDGETSELFASSALLTDQVFTDAEMAALGGAMAGGVMAEPPSPASVQFDFNDPTLAATYGPATLAYGTGSGSGSFIVKGSAFAPGAPGAGDSPSQATLFDQSDAPGNLLVWGAEEARSWSAYVLEATIRSTDNDGIGLVFAYQDEANHYRLTLNGETNRRELVKVQDGVETVLAQVARGSPFDSDIQFRVAVDAGRIDAFVNDRPVFGGPVFDLTRPLPGGTVGIVSDNQRSTLIDDITVNPIALQAFAGADRRVADTDGDGAVRVQLDGGATFGPAAIVDWRWTDEAGAQVATGLTPLAALAPGLRTLTLTATDAAGAVSTDQVAFDVVARSGVLLSEDFAGADSVANWTFVDEGDRGGAGPDGTASSWSLAGGRLTQSSDLQSEQLEWQGATNADLWLRGWSPLGDGVNALRLGTYARYDDPAAAAWTDYSVEARIRTPDDDGLGFLFRYADAANYYKLELDAVGEYDSNPGNGAGSLFRLLRMQDGVEKVLTERPGKYEPGEEFTLRLDVAGGTIQAFLDDEAMFALPVEDRALTAGTIGLYSWGNAGVSFDDVTVLDLRRTAPTAAAGEGVDAVRNSAGSLAPPISPETLMLPGPQAIMGTGDAAGSFLAGGLGSDILTGGLAADALLLQEAGDRDRLLDFTAGGRTDMPGFDAQAGAAPVAGPDPFGPAGFAGGEGMRLQDVSATGLMVSGSA